MANFFTHIPKLVYNTKLVTDIISRIAVRSELMDKISLFYQYELKDGDTPELIAFKYYKDPEKHWIVLLSNEIIDPFFDWPLTSEQFERYLNLKYKNQGLAIDRTGTEYAQITPFAYKAIITTSDSYTESPHTEEFFIDERAYYDQYTDDNAYIFNYSSMSIQQKDVKYKVDKQIITIYEKEFQDNEDRRNIRLLKKEYAAQFEEEFKQLNKIQFL